MLKDHWPFPESAGRLLILLISHALIFISCPEVETCTIFQYSVCVHVTLA